MFPCLNVVGTKRKFILAYIFLVVSFFSGFIFSCRLIHELSFIAYAWCVNDYIFDCIELRAKSVRLFPQKNKP